MEAHHQGQLQPPAGTPPFAPLTLGAGCKHDVHHHLTATTAATAMAVPGSNAAAAADMAAYLQQLQDAAAAAEASKQQQQQSGGGGGAARGEQCPRCASHDTKFCYYNNYNTSQPRHFCRACRRYWTLGGSLRNVPVGGATRKRPRPPRRPPITRAIAAAAAAPGLLQGAAGGLLASLLLDLGSAPPPVHQGRLIGSDSLGLGQPAPLAAAGSADLALAHLDFGVGDPLLWPAATTMVLEGDRAFPLPPPAALWPELTAAVPPALHHGGSPHLLL